MALPQFVFLDQESYLYKEHGVIFTSKQGFILNRMKK